MILLLALILFSCEETNEIGEDFITDKDKVGVFEAILPISTPVKLIDSVITESNSRFLSGSYHDQDLGKVSAEGYMDFFIGQKVPELASDAVFDSLIVELRSLYYYGNDMDQDQILNIHQLKDTIQVIQVEEVGPDSTSRSRLFKYSFQSEEYFEEPLGSVSFSVTDELIDDDSLLTIRLNEDFGELLFDKVKNDTSLINSRTDFGALFKGLAIVPDHQQNSAVIGYSVSNSNMRLYYHSSQDTSSIAFRFSGVTYSSIKTDFAGTALAGLEETEGLFDPAEPRIYSQSGTSIAPVFSFDRFQEYADSVGNIIINEAILEIKIKPYDDFTPPPRFLYVYATDSTYNVLNTATGGLTLDNNGSITAPSQNRVPLNIRFQKNQNAYYLNTTLFLQNLLEENSTINNIMLYPFVSEGSSTTIDRYIADFEDVKLYVYYTTVR
ncbi:MAG: DUF4270 family protein [Candidatus Cyclobacteriaceae bacterium M3_2C_046]